MPSLTTFSTVSEPYQGFGIVSVAPMPVAPAPAASAVAIAIDFLISETSYFFTTATSSR